MKEVKGLFVGFFDDDNLFFFDWVVFVYVFG